MPHLYTARAVAFSVARKNKRRDKDNIAFAKKFILDALVKYGVLGGDSWAYVDGFTDDFVIDKEVPGVTVTVEVIE